MRQKCPNPKCGWENLPDGEGVISYRKRCPKCGKRTVDVAEGE